MTKLTAIQTSAAEPVAPKTIFVHMVIDMQRGYVDALSEQDRNTLPQKIENFIAQVSPFMRTINVGVEDPEMLNFGSEEAKNWDCILKNPDGTTLRVDHWKKGSSAFKYQSNYTVSDRAPAHLHSTQANHIVLTGINKSTCVAETALDAIKKGYRVTIIEDFVADSKGMTSGISLGVQKCIDAGVIFEKSETFLGRLMALQPKQSNDPVLKI